MPARRNRSMSPSMPIRTIPADPTHIDDTRVREIKELAPPAHLLREFPASAGVARLTFETREAIHRVLAGDDARLVAVVGPCSIHDHDAALEYAGRLAALAPELAADLVIVMRVYFEKPRTTVGWKGLINDPRLDDSFRINEGLRLARRILLEINELAVPAGTDGGVKVAVDAVKAASAPHHFLSVTKGGHSAIVHTSGNEDCHIILRGGREPNYDAASVDRVCGELAHAGLAARVMIDCSHANSQKQYQRQIEVARDVAGQIARGDDRIIGVMFESHINPGRQDLLPGQPLEYGVSITDACIGWDASVGVLRELGDAVRRRRVLLTDAS